MPLRFRAIGALALASLMTAGCSMMPFGRDEPRPVARRVAPAPLPAAPTGSVSAAPLAPPPGTVTAAAPGVAPAPGTPPPPGAAPPVGLAALNPAAAGVPAGAPPPPAPPVGVLPPPAGAPPAPGTPAAAPVAPAAPAGSGNVEVGRTDLLGGWTIAAAGDSCQLFMTLTTWSGGYRASTKGCNSDALKTISAWNMEGRQVQLLNDTGTTVARLFPSSKTNFSGQTEGGGPVSVTR